MNSNQRTASLSYSIEIAGLELTEPMKKDRPRPEVAHLTLTTQKQPDRKILLNMKIKIDQLDESERQVADLHQKFAYWVELLVEQFVLTFLHTLNYVGSVRYERGRICSEDQAFITNEHRVSLFHENSTTRALHNDSEEVKNYLHKLGDFSKDTPSRQREIASKMLKTSLSVDDAVVSYLLLYNTLLFVVEPVVKQRRQNNKDKNKRPSQNEVDNFIKDALGSSVGVVTRYGETPGVSTSNGGSVKKWQETLFTKHRNDVGHAHDRSTDKFNWDETVSNIEGQLRELRKLVADAIERYT